jgi:hypothetical protein
MTALRSRLAQTRFQIVLALIVYLLTASILTWPLVLHLGSSIYLSPGRPYGDYTGGLANLQTLFVEPHDPFLPGRVEVLDAPHGLPITWVLNIATFPEIMVQFVLSISLGAIAAYDIFVLLAFLGSGIAMFGLMRSITRRFAVALLAGWAFAFYPFAVAGGDRPSFIHGWPLVLMLWAGLNAVEHPTTRRGALAGGATVLALAWTPYYLLLGGVAFASEIIAALAIGWRERRMRAQVRAFGVASAIVAAYLTVVLVLASIEPTATAQRHNYLAEVVQQTSRPLNYVLAPSWNPLLGQLTGDAVVARGWSNAEKTLYIGISLILLACLAVLAALRRKLPANQSRAVVVAGTVGILATLCSAPPQVTIDHVRVNMPSWYLFHLSNGFRIYERFVIVVELSLCVLAGIGLMSLLMRRRPAIANLVLVVASAVVVLDLWAPIPEHFERLKVPAIYAILARQPPGIYADYPLGPAEERPDYHDLFYQRYAHHPTLNGYQTGSDDEIRDLALGDLTLPDVGARLSALGVRYVLLESHPIPPLTAANAPLPGSGFVELAQDSYGVLYRNDNAPAPLIEPLTGFSSAESSPIGQSRWMDQATASLRIKADCSVCKGILGFAASSFARPRLLMIRNDATNHTTSIEVPAGHPTKISIRLSFNRQVVVSFSTSPGTQSVVATSGSLDQQHVSVSVQAPLFHLTQPRRSSLGTW